MTPGCDPRAALYWIIFFVFCAAGFVFLNAVILYFRDPGRFAPAPDFLTVMIAIAVLEIVLAAGMFYCFLMMIWLPREGSVGRDGEDNLLKFPPKIPHVPQKENQPGRLPPFMQTPYQNFLLLRMLTMLVIVVMGMFILFLPVVRFIARQAGGSIPCSLRWRWQDCPTMELGQEIVPPSTSKTR